MTNTKKISGLKEIIDKYDILILDQWGVMHDGSQGYSHAVDCVEKIFRKKKEIIIISNSSKRQKMSIKRLPKLGFNPNYFLEVMTSGEMIWQSLFKKNYGFTKNIKKNCYHIYDQTNSEGIDFVKGLNKFNYVKKIEDADFILGCTPNPNLKSIDYMPLLKKALLKNIPFICANPDYESIETSSGKPLMCMGTISELYKRLGGSVFLLGKPSIDIYINSTKKINELDKSKILAVGDSIHHDIKGAHLFGVDSLLITSGIHQSSFDKINPEWNSKINKVNNLGIIPTYLCSKFQF